VKYLSIIIVLVVVLIIGGGLTQQLARSNGGMNLPLIQQTNNPDGDPAQMTGWKAEQLFLVIMFILFSPFPPGLIPMAIGLVAVMWFLDWQVRSAKATKGPVSSEIRPATVEPQEKGVKST
jgi:hypothetical protein